MNPDMLTAREALDLVRRGGPDRDGTLPGGLNAFCCDVLELWGVKCKVSQWINLVGMLSSVFVAGMMYERQRKEKTQ